MSSLKDGLGFEEVTNDANLLTDSQDGYFHNVSGANAQFTGSIISALSITTDDYASTFHGTTYSGTSFVDTNGILQSVSIGSGTSVYGAKIQAGSGVLSTGSKAWIVYPISYTGLPTVLVTNRSALTDIQLVNGSLTTGSAYFIGTTASSDFSWMSIGI
jgi:hypothetical protein